MEKAELRRSLIKTRQSMSVAEWKLYSDRICTYINTSPLFTQAKTILAYFSFRQEPDLSPLFVDISFDREQGAGCRVWGVGNKGAQEPSSSQHFTPCPETDKGTCEDQNLRFSGLKSVQACTPTDFFPTPHTPHPTPLFVDGGKDTHIIKRWGFPRCVGDSLSWHLYIKDSLQKSAYGIIEPHADAPTIKPAEVDLIIIPCVACDRQGYRLGYGGGYYDRLLSSPEWATKPTIGIVFDFGYLPQLPIEPWDQPLQNVCTEMGLTKVRN